MKRLLVCIGVVWMMSACQGKTNEGQSNQELKVENVCEVPLDVEGMTCDGCEKTIETGLMTLKGITDVSVDHETGKAIVKADTTLVKKEDMANLIERIGYHVRL